MQAARVIGGAGTGKTSMMIGIMEKAMDRPEVAGNPFALGFSSFTRAARSEAAGRASAAWGVNQGDLERKGWFRTCHSVAYRVLGVSKGEVLGGGKEDDKWVSEALGSDVQATFDEDEGGVAVYAGDPVAAASLNYWSVARSMVVPLREVVEADQSPDAPSAGEVVKRIEAYETAKRLDGRMDFTDMLCRFVGVNNVPAIGPEMVTPQGMVPDEVVGWIFDEAQDASALLDMACQRLVTGASVRWAWLVGDPYQVLYSWAGASSKYFMAWDVGKNQRVMPKSYRCARPILELGERCLKRLGDDYWDRGIAPADHDGEVLESENFEDDLGDIDPRQETLVIARTNRNVSKIAAILDDVGVPFRRVKAKQGAYNRDVGMTGLWKLQHGSETTAEEWTQAIGLLPSRTTDGRTWLTRGTKSQWNAGLKDRYDLMFPEDLPAVGATEHLIGAIKSGEWRGLVDGGNKWYDAAKRWGLDVVAEPKVRIGTIHSVKGQEADNVIVLTSQGRRIAEAEADSPEKFAEERRIEYVAATRARRKLVVAHDPRERYRMELPL